jgi:hypothetical protein
MREHEPVQSILNLGHMWAGRVIITGITHQGRIVKAYPSILALGTLQLPRTEIYPVTLSLAIKHFPSNSLWSVDNEGGSKLRTPLMTCMLFTQGRLHCFIGVGEISLAIERTAVKGWAAAEDAFHPRLSRAF